MSTLGLVVSPVPYRSQDTERSFTAPPLTGSIVGQRVGLRTDLFWRCFDLIGAEWQRLLELAGARDVVPWVAPTRAGQELARAEKEIDEFIDAIDVAIVGLGNCGSCTWWTVRDTVTLVEAGIPSVAVVTSAFEPLARGVATSVGQSNLPLYALPYPLDNREDSELLALAREHFHGVCELLAKGKPG